MNTLPLGRVGVVDRSPSPALPKGREPIPTVFEEVWWNALPLGRVGVGPLCLGITARYLCYSLRVAISRRRYTQSYGFYLTSSFYYPAVGNAFG